MLGIIGGPVVSSTRDTFFYDSLAGFISFLAWVVIVSIFMFVQGSDADDVDAIVVVEGTSA